MLEVERAFASMKAEGENGVYKRGHNSIVYKGK